MRGAWGRGSGAGPLTATGLYCGVPRWRSHNTANAASVSELHAVKQFTLKNVNVTSVKEQTAYLAATTGPHFLTQDYGCPWPLPGDPWNHQVCLMRLSLASWLGTIISRRVTCTAEDLESRRKQRVPVPLFCILLECVPRLTVLVKHFP